MTPRESQTVVIIDDTDARREAWSRALESKGFRVEAFEALPSEESVPSDAVAFLCHLSNFVGRMDLYRSFFLHFSALRPIVFSGGPLLVQDGPADGMVIVDDRNHTWPLIEGQIVLTQPLTDASGEFLASAFADHWSPGDPRSFLEAMTGAWPRATLALYLGALMLLPETGLPEDLRNRIHALDWKSTLNQCEVEALSRGRSGPPQSELATESAAELERWASEVLLGNASS